MALIITITDATTGLGQWTGPLDDFERDNAMGADEMAALWDHGEIQVGGGAAPLFRVTLSETDAATE